ncbi:hypothetical protein GGH94_003149 [Coemansia aciculifera]|uniref:Uncharacterized protein n=1 Tax=Coemansia aciculifera TaxID=417176 RepID=A0A9W8IR05_9FUNG|nr:hypothetical protein GGH94_003149 [Coemansia aciculifera]
MKRVRPSHGPVSGPANGSTAGPSSAAGPQPFRLGEIRQPHLRNPQGIARSIPPRKRMFGLPEAPTYYPTKEEFADPLAYIQKIRPEAEASGLCKIVPPEGWNPHFALDTTKFRFRTRVQQLNSLEGKTRTNLNYLDQLYKFHAQQGNPLPKVPQLDHRPIDLFELRHQVTMRGGFQKVNREKRWAEIGRVMKYDRKSCTSMSTTLKATYSKIVMPFEIYVAKHGGNPPSSPAGAVTDDGADTRRSKRNRMSTDTSDVRPISLPPTRNLSPYGSDIALGAAYPNNNGIADDFNDSDIVDDEEDDDEDVNNIGGSGTYSASARASGGPTASKGPTAPIPERCEICKHSENDDKMLICDGCNRGYHMYCLRPLLTTIPTNDWYCDVCILGAGADFGFEDGAEHTLESFKNKNDEFKRSFFASYYDDSVTRRGVGPAHWGHVPEEKVEEEFWRLVASPFEDVEVEYGADLHSAQHGSGFPTIERDPTDPYAVHPWNLNVLPFQPRSLFNYIKQDISGMKTPWIYVGMCFSTFCWHNEDHYTYSVNYMHWGDTKTWYGVPGRHATRFEDAMRAAVPDLFKDQPDLLFQLVTMLSPGALVGRNVDVVSCDQRAGEFVITFPQSYHAGFNQGFNFNEAVNFATSDWMPYDVPSVKRYQHYERNPVFSHDELVMSMCEADPSFLHQSWFQDAILEVAHREKADRARVRSLWRTGIGEAAWDDVEEGDLDLPDEIKQQCYVCKAFSFLSAVVCSCSPNYISCLLHAETSCKCVGDQKILKQRYSDNDLQAIINRCNGGPTTGSMDDDQQLHASPPDPTLPTSQPDMAIDKDDSSVEVQSEEAHTESSDVGEEQVGGLSQSQLWEQEFRRIMSLYTSTSPGKTPSSPGTSTTTFVQPGSTQNGDEGDLANGGGESDGTVSDDMATMHGASLEPKPSRTAAKRLLAAAPGLHFPPRVTKGTMSVADLNRRPDLMQMMLLLEEAQRLVLPGGDGQSASRKSQPNSPTARALSSRQSGTLALSPARGGRGRGRGIKRKPGRPSNKSKLETSMLVAKAAPVGGMVVSPGGQKNGDDDPLDILLGGIERLVSMQESTSPYSAKKLVVQVDSQALGDMRQLGLFVQRAQEWCRAAQAMLSCVGRSQMVEAIQRKRQANYEWHRDKLHKRFGGLDIYATDDVATPATITTPVSANSEPFSSIGRGAADFEDTRKSKMKRYLDDSEESSSNESSEEDVVDTEFKAPIKRPVGRPRGSKRGRIPTSQYAGRNMGREGNGRSLRSSANDLRSQSAEPRHSTPWSSRLRTEDTPLTSAPLRSRERLRGLGTLTNLPTSPRGLPEQAKAVYRILGNSLSALNKDADLGGANTNALFSSKDVASLLLIGEQLYFNSPEFEALIEYELEVLNIEVRVQAVADNGPAELDRLSRMPAVLTESTTGAIAKVGVFRHQLTTLRDSLDGAQVRVSRSREMLDIADKAQWIYDCHQQLAQRDIAPSTVTRLLDEAAELNIGMDFEPLKQLKDTQFDAGKWSEDAAAIGLEESSREPLDVCEIAKLLDRAHRSSTLPDNYHTLRRLQQTALDLESRTNELVDRSERSGLVERPTYSEAVALVADCDKFGRFEPSSLDQLRSTIAKVDVWWTDVGQMFSFDQHSRPLEDKLVGVEYRLKQTLAIAGGTDDSAADLYCVCLGPDSGLMVECEACHEWYHLFCVNLNPADIQNSLFLCSLCDARARADKPRLLADYPTIGRIEDAVKESRSFGLVVGALDPLVTILLDAKSLVELLNDLISTKTTGSAQRMQRPAYLRSLLRALLGLGVNLRSGVLDGLWAALSELLKHEPVPKIIPGATVSSRRSQRSKPASTMPAVESEPLAQVIANESLQGPQPPSPSLHQPQQQAQPQPQQQVQPDWQKQLGRSEVIFVDDIPSGDMQPELMAMYMSRLEELGIYIMNPPLLDRDMGQGLVQARDAFSKSTENCLCDVKGSDLDDSNPMSFMPTIMCDDCSMSFHTECAQVSIPTARIITFNQLRIMANAELDESDNIPMEPSRFSCPSCCLKANEQYRYADIVVSD